MQKIKRIVYLDLAFAITVLVMNPFAISLSMQFPSMYYITLSAILVLIKYDKWFMKNEDRLPYLFMFSGILIAMLIYYMLIIINYLFIDF